jgi:hypothetical protein
MCGKYSLTKFASFLYYAVLRAENLYCTTDIFYYVENLRTSQGYILQHFASTFWNFTALKRFFVFFPELAKIKN